MPKKPSIDFEKALADLQEIVDSLENKQLPLNLALAKFEQGIKLSNDCQQALRNAEQKVQLLLTEHGQARLQDFQAVDEL
jgi:exodeoxyribonuclease VII small subunit